MCIPLDPDALTKDFATAGYAVRPLLDARSCRALVDLYDDDRRFRSRVVMARHSFGSGEYKYLAYPLPEPVQALRTSLYPPLAAIANAWRQSLGKSAAFRSNESAAFPPTESAAFPPTHAEYLARCHAAGQTRPTPLLLRYGPGDYNCLHQDLYGELVFPLQLTILLNEPGRDFTGGEFVLTEQRPRAQSRAEVVPLRLGEAVIFPVHHRPVAGTRGTYRVTMRHGVSRIRSGVRHTVGIIFHDAA